MSVEKGEKLKVCPEARCYYEESSKDLQKVD